MSTHVLIPVLPRFRTDTAPNMSTSSPVVVVIEDDSSMLKGLGRLLGTLGFSPVLFRSAEDYLNHCSTFDAACLLLDIHLDGISGIDLTRQLAMSGSRIPVVFMTASANAETERRARSAGCVAYLHKPFRSSALVEALQRATA